MRFPIAFKVEWHEICLEFLQFIRSSRSIGIVVCVTTPLNVNCKYFFNLLLVVAGRSRSIVRSRDQHMSFTGARQFCYRQRGEKFIFAINKSVVFYMKYLWDRVPITLRSLLNQLSPQYGSHTYGNHTQRVQKLICNPILSWQCYRMPCSA